jgi:hypothetical protein
MRTLLLTFIAVLAACDPAALQKESAPTKLEEARKDVSGDRTSLAACLQSCSEGDATATDRATCRLNCETAFKVTPTAVVDDGVTAATRCLQGCRGKDGDGCRAGCRGGAGAPTGAAIERLEQCVDACGADKTLSEDNRATCDLTCAQEARRLAGGKS